MVGDIHQYLPFLIEIDRLKLVNRQSRLKGNGRQENSAEHSWHLALFALSLGRDQSLDLFKLVRMLLVHDWWKSMPATGRSMLLRGKCRKWQWPRRQRHGGYLGCFLANGPTNTSPRETAEASFARAIDRLQPLILNLLNDGGTWVENNVTEEMIAERYGVPIRAAFPDLWPDIWSLVKQHFAGVPLELTQTAS